LNIFLKKLGYLKKSLYLYGIFEMNQILILRKMKTLEFKNRKNETITVEYRSLGENEVNHNNISKSFISKVKVNGTTIASCIYSPGTTEKELKSTGNYYRNARKYKFTA